MSTAIDQAQALKALDALRAYHARAAESALIEDDGEVHLSVAFKTIPQAKPDRHRYARLSHGPVAGSGSASPSVCVFVKDPQSDAKVVLANAGVKVARVLGVTKLRAKFATYEARRELCDTYDVFLADDRVIPMLPKALGKKFYDSKKVPIPIVLDTFTPEKLAAALRTVPFSVPTGTMTDVSVGSLAHLTSDQLLANAMDAVSALTAALPKRCHGFESVLSLGFRLKNTPALPFYNSLPRAATPAELEAKKARAEESKGKAQRKRMSKWDAMRAEIEDSEDEEAESTEAAPAAEEAAAEEGAMEVDA
ncbi:proteasome-interacting protein cic1 [Blastocladiella emersonii ATCC 22665]|nr:proteasome-interacting protein cic1 [Blastocladiella emersonii ATCC 22665]